MRWRERAFPGWIWRLPAGNGQIALTFDDGPDPASTPQLLSMLDSLTIRTTMFLLGKPCDAQRELIRKCGAANHTLAVHGFTHESFLFHSGNWQREQILRAMGILQESGAEWARLFRPPYGRFNPATARVLTELDFTGVLWSRIVRDWVPKEIAQIERRLTGDLHDGSIIVLHDRPQTIRNVLQVLPCLADEVNRRGWQFTTLSHPTAHPLADL